LSRIKAFLGIALVAVVSIILHTKSFACTAVYIGKDVSKDGTTIIARSVEWLPGYMSCVDSYEARKHKKGDFIEDSVSGFKYECPEETYKYILAATMDYAEDGKTTDACVNEYGLAVSATVTAYANEKALKADPLVEDGISEGSISLVLGSSCKNAREAVELLCDIVDEYGSAESNIIFIADQEEAWYVEVYTGHQYAAIKMPENKAAVVGNQFMLRGFNIKDKDVYFSKDLVNLAKKNKFAVFEDNGCINLFETYADGVNSYNYPRVWKGQQMLAPGKSSKYDPDEEYELFFKPEGKVAFEDVVSIYRSEYDEDDEFNLEDDEYVGPISTSTINSMHVIEIFDDLPAEMSNVLWVCNSPAKYGQFVPISNIVDKIPESYSTNLSERGYVEGVAACEFNRLYGISIMNPDYIGKKVVAYNTGIEKANYYDFDNHMKEWKSEYKKNPSKVKKNITQYCSDVMEEAVNDAQRVFDEISWYLAAQVYPVYAIDNNKAVKNDFAPFGTFKLGFDFERIAKKYGWDVKHDDKELTATKDDKIVTITLDEVEPYNNDQINWKTCEVLVTEEEKKSQKLNERTEDLNNIILSDKNSDEVKRYATYVRNDDGKVMTFVNFFSFFE